MKNKGFTLIELIVVITILAILGTIAFISFKGYTGSARDSKVTTDIANLHNSLAILKATEGVLPMPDNLKKVTVGSTELTYEGEVGVVVKSTVKASGDMKTPMGDNYKYAVTKDQKDFTLVGLLKNESANLMTKAYADDANIKYFKGGKVTTLFDSNNNFKGGDLLSLSTGDEVYLGDIKKPLDGTDLILNSCREIKDYKGITTDGTYQIAPEGIAFDVYCDMTTDGGGWTKVYQSELVYMSKDKIRNKDWEDGTNFSRLYSLRDQKKDGKYEFRVVSNVQDKGDLTLTENAQFQFKQSTPYNTSDDVLGYEKTGGNYDIVGWEAQDTNYGMGLKVPNIGNSNYKMNERCVLALSGGQVNGDRWSCIQNTENNWNVGPVLWIDGHSRASNKTEIYQR